MRESALGRASEGADEPVLAEHLGDSWSHLPVLDTQGLPPLATAELEQLLFSPSSSTQLSRLKPAADSWTAKFPDLTSLPRPSGETRPLSICVATEDIVGPVRNGGIGSTYAALAAALAKAGHRVTILYLRGGEVEIGALEQWTEHYAALGVTFVPVPNYASRHGFRSPADRWLRAPYNMMHYLLEHPADVVHVSEWRGSGYLSMLAKQQGLAFADTTFIVKASSPWLWNRLYTSQALERAEDLVKIEAERRSIELADVVIGGSAHLLRWMLSQGYAIARERAFVQPNFVNFDPLAPLMQKRALAPGSRMPVDELVFFGRLEARKGLVVFCQAIRRLIRQGGKLPPVITFMGKAGNNLTARPDETVLDYIEGETKDWPVKVEILTEFQQHEAVEYLLGGSRLAVMPSLIENSSVAVYEAAICRIPFIASAVGGTSELLRVEDHRHVLFEPHPIPLAEKIAEAMQLGAHVARPSFDNDENIGVWLRFHEDLSRGLGRHFARPVPPRIAAPPASLAVCIYHTGDIDLLRETLNSLAAQSAPCARVLIAVDAPDQAATGRVNALIGERSLPCQVVGTFDMDAGLSFNTLAERASEDFLLFLWEGTVLHPEATAVVRGASERTGADVLNFLCREVDASAPGTGLLKGPVIGDATESIFRTEVMPQPLLVRRRVFEALGRFTSDYRVLAFDREFIAKAQVSGVRCTTVLSELASVPVLSRDWLNEHCYDEQASLFRAIRPQLAAVPLATRDAFLVARGAAIRAAISRAKNPPAPLAAAKKLPAGRLIQIPPAEVPKIVPTATVLPPTPGTAGAAANLPLHPAPHLVAADTVITPPVAHDHAAAAAKSADTRKLDRRLLFAKDGIVHGWAMDAAHPERTLIVEAVADGEVIARARADNSVVLPGRMRRSHVDGHGFSLRLFPKWKPKVMQRGGRVFDIRIEGGGYVAKGIEVYAPGATIDDSPFEGYCDPSADGSVVGWAWLPGDPDQKVDVIILIDGQFYGRVHADHHRDDLVPNGIGNGEHGFRMAVNLSDLKDGDHVVEVLIAQYGVALKRSPMTLRKRRISPASPYRWFSRRLRGVSVVSEVADQRKSRLWRR